MQQKKKATAMVSVQDPLIFLTDPGIRNPELWMPINYGSGSGPPLKFVAIEKDIVKIGGKSEILKFL